MSVSVIRIEISDVDYTGSPQELKLGGVPLYIDFQSSGEDKTSALIGSSATFQFVSDENFKLEDIYSDSDTKLRVDIFMDGAIKWKGFVTPDLCTETFADYPYVINIRAIDGIGTLKKALYNDSNGVIFTGQKNIMQIITECLAKTKQDMQILTYSKFEYSGMSSSSDFFKLAKVWSERFIEDYENEIPMFCGEVLESLLSLWACKIVQRDGIWVIYNLIDLVSSNGTIEGFLYSSNGLFQSMRTINASVLLGNNSGDIIHCDADQNVSIERAYNKVEVKYTYGLVHNTVNRGAQKFLPASPTTFSDWDKIGGINATPMLNVDTPAKLLGKLTLPSDARVLALKNQVNVRNVSRVKLEITFNIGRGNILPFIISLWNGTTFLRLQRDGSFSASSTLNYIEAYNKADNGNTWGMNKIVKGEQEFDLPTGLPSTAYINLSILNVQFFDSNIYKSDSGQTLLYDLKLTPTSEQKKIVSETHTSKNNVTYTTNPSEITVLNGESKFRWALGTIFQTDGINTTTAWRRKGETLYSQLLQIKAYDTLRLYQKPMRKYEGTVYGYFDFFSIFTLTHLGGKFIPISAKYNMRTNKTSLVLIEVTDAQLSATNTVIYENPEADKGGVENV